MTTYLYLARSIKLAAAFILTFALLLPCAALGADSETPAGAKENQSNPAQPEKKIEEGNSTPAQREKKVEENKSNPGHPENKSEKPEEEKMATQPAQTSPDSEAVIPEQITYPGVRKILIRQSAPGKPTINFFYPALGNEKIDQDVKKFAEDATVEFIKEQAEYGDPENNDLSATYTITYPSENVVSIIFNIYSYESGAHGNLVLVALNYDLHNGARLKFADIFQDPQKALEIMSEISFKRLTEELGEDSDEEMIRNGTTPEEKNFSTLSLTPKGVTVEFQPYQVGPWSIGAQELAIPLADLAAAKPSTLVWPTGATDTTGH